MYDHLSALAQRLGRYMAEHCENGLPGHFGDELLDAFPDSDRKSLGVALAELKADGLVELSPLIGPKLPRVHTTNALFVAADPAITRQDPVADSVVLARFLIDDAKLGHAPSLERQAGWPRRRFNPAFALLVPLFPAGRVRAAIQNDYPTLGVIVSDDDVVELRRYVSANTR